ncbi:MAG: hypothetical protein JKY42_00305 [Flavobacteriales bacterium]|nr:hypothetical protein [Flavobacteriales bacterium]
MHRLYLLTIIVIFSTQILAHQDRIIEVSKSGNMVGLPERYLPAKIDLNKSTISIGRAVFNMPICVSKYFANPDSYKMLVTSSWYHQRWKLPPYINFNIAPKGKDFEYSLLFELDNLMVIKFQVITKNNEQVKEFHKIDISEHCTKSIGSSYVTTQ